MKCVRSSDLEKKWSALVEFVTSKFGGGEYLDTQAVLFLIGLNELGQGYKDFKKDFVYESYFTSYKCKLDCNNDSRECIIEENL